MFEKYQSAVIGAYVKLRDDGVLLTNLSQPVPAGLRDEALDAYDQRYDKKDLAALASFYGIKGTEGDEEADRLLIKKMDTGKFKRLMTVMKDEGGNTDPKNIELLAWLIDFQPRPFAAWKKACQASGPSDVQELPWAVEESQVPAVVNDEPAAPGDVPIILPPVGVGSIITKRRLGWSILGAAVLAGMVFGAYRWGQPRLTGEEKCMYWDNDHYQPISCNARPKDSSLTVLALDTARERHFRRITRADTLTGASIGKVYYVYINGDYEYYTAGGQHPLYPEKRLLKLSARIMDRHPRHAD